MSRKLHSEVCLQIIRHCEWPFPCQQSNFQLISNKINQCARFHNDLKSKFYLLLSRKLHSEVCLQIIRHCEWPCPCQQSNFQLISNKINQCARFHNDLKSKFYLLFSRRLHSEVCVQIIRHCEWPCPCQQSNFQLISTKINQCARFHNDLKSKFYLLFSRKLHSEVCVQIMRHCEWPCPCQQSNFQLISNKIDQFLRFHNDLKSKFYLLFSRKLHSEVCVQIMSYCEWPCPCQQSNFQLISNKINQCARFHNDLKSKFYLLFSRKLHSEVCVQIMRHCEWPFPCQQSNFQLISNKINQFLRFHNDLKSKFYLLFSRKLHSEVCVQIMRDCEWPCPCQQSNFQLISNKIDQFLRFHNDLKSKF